MSHWFLVDSHCHLDCLALDAFQGDLDQALAAARANRVRYFLNVCIHTDKIDTLLHIANHYTDMSISVGLHPTEVIAQEPTVEELIAWASHPKVVALGETGLDYYRSNTNHTLQKQRFRNHIRAAKQVNKPLIVHTRAAVEDTLTILKEENAHTIGGVLHCFTETLAMARTAIEDLGFYISFSGVLTFKNAQPLRDIATQLPLERLLIETDSPYLTPEPFRGKQANHPANVVYVAQRLAQLHQVSLEQLGQQTSDNFFRLFKHSQRPIDA